MFQTRSDISDFLIKLQHRFSHKLTDIPSAGGNKSYLRCSSENAMMWSTQEIPAGFYHTIVLALCHTPC